MRIAAVVWSVALATPAFAQQGPVDQRIVRNVMRIGGDSATVVGSFSHIVDLKVAANGDIYVLDAGTQSVRILSPRGVSLRTIELGSREAVTPARPARMWLVDSAVFVLDTAEKMVLSYSLLGKALGKTPMGKSGDTLRAVALRGGSKVVELAPRISRTDPVAPLYRDVVLLRPSGARTVLFRIRTDTVFLRRASELDGEAFARASRFGPGGAWDVFGDSLIAYADGFTGAIVWYVASGDSVRVMRSGEVGRVAPPVLADEILQEAQRLGRAEPARFLRGPRPLLGVDETKPVATLFGAPARWSVATRAFFSEEGAFFVGTNRIYIAYEPGAKFVVGADNNWAVYPPFGPPFVVPLSPFMRLTAARGDLLYGFYSPGGMEPFVVVYRLL